MARRLALRLLDIVGLIATGLVAAGMAIGAVNADGWLARVALSVVAASLAVFLVRATPFFLREWRSQPRPES